MHTTHAFHLLSNMYHPFFVAALFHVAFAMSSGPAPTQFHLLNHEEMAMKGISPAPTPAPKKRNPTSLFERQDDISRGSETCGFWSAEPYSSVTCTSNSACIFNEEYSWFGCCSNEADCTSIYTECVPSIFASNTFESASILTCTEGVYTECMTWLNIWDTISFTYTYYFCTSTYGITALWRDAIVTTLNSLEPSTISPTSDSSIPISSTSSPPLEPPVSIPVPDSKHPTPVGAIVGGVIGGIATLAFIVFGIFFLRRWKKTAPSGSVQYNHPETTTGQDNSASMRVPITNQDEYSKQNMSPSSPTSPYQPPYSPPLQTVHAHDVHIAQLP